MSNPYYTKIEIHHDSLDELRKLDQLIHEWTSKNFIKNDFGLNWLGNVVGNSGIGSVKKEDANSLNCRGIIIERDLHKGKIIIETETYGSVMLKIWVKLLEAYLPDAKLIYHADDNSDGYWTNDPELAGKYIIDPYDIEDIEYTCEATEEDLKTILQALLETEENDIDSLMELLADSEYDGEIGICQWEFVAADKWD